MNPNLKHVIAYPREKGGIAILYPNLDCGLSVQDIAEKDVPADTPYVIIPEVTVPNNNVFFDAFEIDFSFPNGTGLGPEAWFLKQQTAIQSE